MAVCECCELRCIGQDMNAARSMCARRIMASNAQGDLIPRDQLPPEPKKLTSMGSGLEKERT